MKIKLNKDCVIGTGKTGKKDEIVMVDDKTGKNLVSSGAAQACEESDNSEDVPQKEIVAAMEALDPDDESLWTASGAPAVPALEAVLECKITAKQRDDAWAEIDKD